ncbi:type II/IV secretion system ATPase subunit [Haloarcula laminariae]|uniref:type II/IV secretion system ATPase subunit n=1 Tax=Haloarcula laminariae TaxID=2961577 RepID=UPI0021C9E594|nr:MULTISPECIES: type II/IV secretion system ATPase subunit [Halomicroarcula]
MSGPETDRDEEAPADWATRIGDGADEPDHEDGAVAAGRDQPDGAIEQVEPVAEPPPPPDETVVERVKSWFDGHESDFAPAPSPEFVEDEFFDLSYRADATEVDRYWVDEPFAYIAILEADGDHRYHVVEPSLSTFEEYVRDDIMADLRDVLMHVEAGESDRSERLSSELGTMLSRYTQDAEPGSLHKIRYYIERDLLGYDRISPLLADRNLEDISCDGTDVPVYVYHHEYRDMVTNIRFGAERLNSLVVRLAQRSDRHISVADPMVDASLPNGSRIQMTLGTEVSTRGSNFTIRQFSDVPLTPIDLINFGSFSVETMTYFWLAIQNNLSLMFAGGTASGKTTAMNAISMFIPERNKVISIEDTREITLPHENWIQSVTRESQASGSGEIGMYKLLQAALRQRPEYLLVGEIRTEPEVALAFFQAMATGHAAYTTFHADSTETVLSRLQNPPLSVPEQMVRELDIISIQRQIFVGDRRVRRNVGIAELGREDGEHTTRDVYEWQPTTDTFRPVEQSGKLREIMYTNGWDEERLQTELSNRERLLRRMVREDISDYESFQTVVWRYNSHPEEVLELLDSGDLDSLL